MPHDVIHSLFLPFGPIVSLTLPLATDSPAQNKGYAEVHYEDARDAAAALDNMDGFELFDRPLRVKPSAITAPHASGAISVDTIDTKKSIWNQQ